MRKSLQIFLVVMACLMPFVHLSQTAQQVEHEEVGEKKGTNEIDSKQLFEIDSKSLQFIVQQTKIVVALFYEEQYPQEFETILSESAKEIATYRLAQQLPIALFGTVNTHQDTETLSTYNISYKSEKRYQLVLYINTNQINYEGDYTQSAIVSFIHEKIENSIRIIKSEEELKSYTNGRDKKRVLIGSNNSTFIGQLQEKEQNYELFTNLDVSEVRIVSDLSLLKDSPAFKEATFPFVCFIKDNQFPEEQQYHFYKGSFDQIEWIKDFVQTESVNLVEELNADSYIRIFGGSVESQIHLFLDSKVDNSKVIQEFRKAALHNKEEELKYERMVFVIQYYSDETKEFIELYDVRGVEELPFIGVSTLDYNNFGVTKYIFNKENAIEFDNIVQFMDDVRKKTIDAHFRSEDLPTDQELQKQEKNKIFKIVAKNFKERVQKEKYSYFILFWDSKDKTSAKEYYDLLKEFVKQIPASQYEHLLKIGTFDLHKNEVEYLNIDQAPKLVVYPQYYKQNPQAYKGPLKLEPITKFLNQWVRDLSVSVPLSLGGTQKSDL